MRSPAIPLGHPGLSIPSFGPEVITMLESYGAVIFHTVATKVLKVTDPRVWVIQGTFATTQTFRLPKEAEMLLGTMFVFINRSNGLVGIRNSANTVLSPSLIMPVGNVNATISFLFLIDNLTSNLSWGFANLFTSYSAGKSLTVSNSLTLAGTDGTIQTFPTVSSQVASKNIDSNFSFLQTFAAHLRLTPVALGTLPAPAAGNAGQRATINDQNVAPVFGAIAVAGAGGFTCPVYSDGVNWIIG